ncbi:MAG: HAD-IC family P-type ATPase [Candidatus Andersenbacteria bacterium]
MIKSFPSQESFQPYRMKRADVLNALSVRADQGLSTREVKKRTEQLGRNELPKARKHRLLWMFLERFRDVLVLLLVAAAVVSFLIGHTEDVIIIAIAILIDVSLSFVQVWRTEQTLARMRQRIEDTITVRRNGRSSSVSSAELVPGDIIEFRAGERVPADARLIKAQGVRAQEAALTGESGDVEKHTHPISTKTPLSNRANMLLAGTIIISGTGEAVVTHTGTRTEFGKIAQVLREQRSPDSPLRKKLQKKGIQIGWLIIAAVILLTIIEIRQGSPIAEAGRTAITLMVSAIPEDLTMILTIALTVGVARILRKGGVVRKLSSGETLGAATVICTDKTGTLTEGKMKPIALHFLQGDSLTMGHSPQETMHILALQGLLLANDAHKASTNHGEQEYIGSATERTALLFTEQLGLNSEEVRTSWRKRDAIAFGSEWKYRAALVDHPTQSTQTLFVTGAPDVLLSRSSQALNAQNEVERCTSAHRHSLEQNINHLAGQGYRLIAVAVRRHLTQTELTHNDIHDLTLLGVLTIEDPIREDVASSIKETLSAGVQIKLITGDHLGTAKAVARAAGLIANEDTSIGGLKLQEMKDDELARDMSTTTIFSRIEPLDKRRIIRILQEQGHVVAMTGDGVNDAVALKSADIGVAMGSGTDIAKDSADLVLLDNSFSTIVAAIKEGRVIRDNIRKVIVFLLATNAAEVAIFFVSVLTGLPLPLLPTQILWINLVTDGTSDIALSLEPAEDDVMKRQPEDPQISLLSKTLVSHIIFSGLVMTVGTMSLFWYLLQYMNTDLAYARTMAFTFLSVASLLSVWSFKSLRFMMFHQTFWNNKWIFVSAAFSFSLHLLAVYLPALRSFFHTVPLALTDWGVILAMAALTIFIIDLRKLVIRQPETPPAWLPVPRAASSK